MTKKVKFKVNAAIGGKVAGQIITLDCDKSGIPLKSFWRRRLRDSETDKCMEKYTEPKQAKSAKKPQPTAETSNSDSGEA